jgi:SH3-like domain-containing protein
LKLEPFRDANAVATLTAGDKVEILERQGTWFRVRTTKGAGWVRMLSVRRGERAKSSAEGEVSGLRLIPSPTTA